MRNRGYLMAALVLLLLLIAGAAPASDAERVEERPLEPGRTLVFDLEQGGSIHVEGWDRSLARIVWHDDMGDVDDFDVEVRPIRDGLKIEADWARRRSRDSNALTFEVKVPHKTGIEFHTGGGTLQLRDLEGEFTGRTAGGGLVLEKVKGKVDLVSGGGNIHVEDAELDGSIVTGGGPVLVEDVVGDLRARSGGGDIRYVNVRGRDGRMRGPGGRLSGEGITAETVLIDSNGGAIKVREAAAGAIVSTGGGNVTVRDAERFVKAWTGGGDIDIEVRDGWVEAGTGAGDIEVQVEKGFGEGGKGIDLGSGYGNVTLIVPPGAKLDLDLTIKYTRNSARDYRIESDLPVAEEHTREWDTSDHGSPCKYIHGTSAESGVLPVRIHTTNGDIRIQVQG